MGSFGTGFIQSIGEAAHSKAQRQHQLEQEEKQREAQFHWGALQAAINRGGYVDPGGNFVAYKPEDYQKMVETTVGNVSKSYGNSKPMKELWGKAQNMIGALVHHPNFHAQEEPAAGGSAQPQGTAAPNQAAPAQPEALTPAHASDLTVPPPPGASAAPADPTMLAPSGASDAAAGSADTATTTAARFPFPAPPPAAAAPAAGVSNPPQENIQADADTQQTPATVAPPPQVPATSGPANSPAAAALAQPTVIPAHSAVRGGAIPPPPGSTPQQMLNGYISPIQQSQMGNQVQLANQQAKFQQEQAQLATRKATLEKQLGRPLTTDETLMLAGVKMPAGYLTPHYNSKLVEGSNLPSNAVMVDGSQPEPGKLYQQQFARNGQPVFGPVNVPHSFQTFGNERHAVNSYTGEDLGAISNDPVRVPTATSNLAAATVMTANGPVQLPGSRSNTPITYKAPLVGASKPEQAAVQAGAPAAPVSPLLPPGHSPVTSTGKPSKQAKQAAAETLPENKGGAALPKGARSLPGLPTGMYNQQQKRNTAINVAGSALKKFTQPQDGGLSNLDVFKSPAAVSRIGDYLKLNNALMEGDFESAEKGGVTGSLGFMMGIPQSYMHAQNKAAQEAYQRLTPADQRFVSDYYFLMGNWGAMRAATGANASQWNFKNMAQEVPNPMTMGSYTEAKRKIEDLFGEFSKVAEPNMSVDKYSLSDILPKNSNPLNPPGGMQAKRLYAKGQNGHRIYSDDDQKTWYDAATNKRLP